MLLAVFAATPRCNGCPSHFCDDDPAIIHGYCCGCAGYFGMYLYVFCIGIQKYSRLYTYFCYQLLKI